MDQPVVGLDQLLDLLAEPKRRSRIIANIRDAQVRLREALGADANREVEGVLLSLIFMSLMQVGAGGYDDGVGL